MRLLMISGDRSILEGKQGAFWYTLQEFSKRWERIDVICPRTTSTRDVMVRQAHHDMLCFFENVFFHPCPHGLWKQSSWIKFKGKELVDQFHHDVMTVHEYPPFYNGIGALGLAKMTKVPCVLEIHHIVGYPKAGSLTERIGKILSRIYLPIATRKASGVRTVSKDGAQTLIKWGVPERKIRVVPSFYLDAQAFASLGEMPKPRYDVVFCGRLVANKGVKELLEAIGTLPDVTLLIIGDGPERQKLERLARSLKIAPRVEFRGWLRTQDEVLRTIRTARVLVMNSKSEGGPRIALEAMASGVPVIVTKVGVMPDVIVDGVNGLFTTGKPEDVAQNIEKVLTDPVLRSRMMEEGRRIIERFERTKLIDQYAHYLQSFASPR